MVRGRLSCELCRQYLSANCASVKERSQREWETCDADMKPVQERHITRLDLAALCTSSRPSIVSVSAPISCR